MNAISKCAKPTNTLLSRRSFFCVVYVLFDIDFSMLIFQNYLFWIVSWLFLKKLIRCYKTDIYLYTYNV